MQMLKKIFNSDSKYYLELDEALESEPVQQAVETVKETAEIAQDKLQSAVETDAKPEVKSSKKPAEKEAVKSEQKTEAKAKPSTANAGASSFDPPFWVAAMYKKSDAAVNSDGTQAEQTFATDNLMPTVTKYRRNPGPSLNKFKDMASKAKTPKR